MEEILPFLVVAIILISSALQTRRQQRRKQQAQPAMPPRVPQAPAMVDVEPTVLPAQPAVSEVRPKPTAVSRPTVTTSLSTPAQAADTLKTSTPERVQPEMMRHFDLKQAILYSEIMTPKF